MSPLQQGATCHDAFFVYLSLLQLLMQGETSDGFPPLSLSSTVPSSWLLDLQQVTFEGLHVSAVLHTNHVKHGTYRKLYQLSGMLFHVNGLEMNLFI